MIPNISKYLPPVSQYIPLVSSIPPETLSHRLGVRPAWPGYREISRRQDREPVEIGFFPARGIAWVAESLEKQATEEQDTELRLKDERLSLEMRLEMGEITEEEFNKRAEELDRKIEEIKGLSE